MREWLGGSMAASGEQLSNKYIHKKRTKAQDGFKMGKLLEQASSLNAACSLTEVAQSRNI